jgi:hypothetical protein
MKLSYLVGNWSLRLVPCCLLAELQGCPVVGDEFASKAQHPADVQMIMCPTTPIAYSWWRQEENKKCHDGLTSEPWEIGGRDGAG